MLTLNCLVAGCKEQVANMDEDIAVALLNAHISTHTADTGRNKGSDSSRSVELVRPEITQGTTRESWRSSQTLRRLYDTNTDLSKAGCDRKPEIDQSKPMQKLPTALAERFDGTQEAEELSQIRIVKGRGIAANCVPKTKYYRNGAGSTRSASHALANGPVDVETPREVLDWNSLNGNPLDDAVMFVEHMERARVTRKGKDATEKTEYGEQEAANQVDEAKLHTGSKCESCGNQFNKNAGAKPGKVQRHELCKKCWKRSRRIRDPEAARRKETPIRVGSESSTRPRQIKVRCRKSRS